MALVLNFSIGQYLAYSIGWSYVSKVETMGPGYGPRTSTNRSLFLRNIRFLLRGTYGLGVASKSMLATVILYLESLKLTWGLLDPQDQGD